MQHLESAIGKKNEWWRYLLMFFSIFVVSNVVIAIPLLFLLGSAAGVDSSGRVLQETVDKNVFLLFMLIPFVVSLLLFVWLVKPFHGQTFKAVINGRNSIRWRRFFYAFAVWAVIMATYLIIDISINSDNFTFNFSLNKFLPLVLIAVLLIPFQTTFEEVMFRGYLAQGVGVWTKSRIWVILIPSFLFGMMHVMNPEVEEYGFWLTMPQYILMGVAFGLVTVLDDGIEVSMGAHAANNIFLSIFLTFKGSALDTPALFVQKEIDPQKDLIALVIFLTLFVFVLSKKYKWDFKVLLAPVRK